MAKFDDAIDLIIQHEGTVYTETPGDLGGATKFGVTIPALNEFNGQNNSADDIRALTLANAKALYLKCYWSALLLSQINDQKVATIVFDQAVLCGKSRIVKELQNIVGTMSDGIMGHQTVAACNSMNSTNLIVAILGARTLYFASLVQQNTSQLKFLKGWEARVVSLLNYAFKIT